MDSGLELVDLDKKISCSASFRCMLEGGVEFERRTFYIGSLRVELVLACQEVLN
jgi:hypothetical protein